MAAVTTTTAQFTVPAIGATTNIDVGDTAWLVVGSKLIIETAGAYDVTSITNATRFVGRNLGYSINAAAATVIATGVDVNPGDISSTEPMNSYGGHSATTTKGDILADNGANNPNGPSLVRLAVGTDGKTLVADSAQPTGLNYVAVTPNTATNDNNIPRFNGTTGTPMVLQDSSLLITDDGAIQSTPTGGNARGSKAIDLQVDRSNNTEVASGANSVICGGAANTASAAHSIVAGGSGNVASQTRASVLGGIGNISSANQSSICGGTGNTASGGSSFIGGGETNTASSTDSAVVAGTGNTASNTNAFVGGGSTNTASGVGAIVIGGANNTASASYALASGNQVLADKLGQRAMASGSFTVQGDAQTSELIFRNATTDATPTILYLNGSTATARASISTGSSWAFRGLVIGRRDNGDSAGWEFTGVIHNNTGTTALTAAIVATLIAADAGCAATWGVAGSIAVTADNANDALQIEVTGTAGNNIQWVATVKTVETIY